MKFLFLLLLVSFNLWAQELKLANISSDIDQERTEFLLVRNAEGSIDSARFVSYTPQGQITRDNTWPVESIIQDGVVLYEKNGYQVLKLKADKNFSTMTGGEVVLNYLYNGMDGTRRFIRLKIINTPETAQIFSHQGKKVNKFFVKGNRNVFFGLIGVKEIVSSFEEIPHDETDDDREDNAGYEWKVEAEVPAL